MLKDFLGGLLKKSFLSSVMAFTVLTVYFFRISTKTVAEATDVMNTWGFWACVILGIGMAASTTSKIIERKKPEVKEIKNG